MLAFERTQEVDWEGCRKDAARVVDGVTGHFHHVPDFFRYDYDPGDIDDLPRRRVGNRFESYARHVPVRFVSTIGKDKTPLELDALAYRPYCLSEYCLVNSHLLCSILPTSLRMKVNTGTSMIRRFVIVCLLYTSPSPRDA